MKKYIVFVLTICSTFFLLACSEDNGTDQGQIEEPVALEALTMELEGLESAETKATETGYSVNRAIDPTHTMTGREAWSLDVSIYNAQSNPANQLYGQSTFIWSATDSEWVPQTPIWFPNYLTQRMSLRLYPTPDPGVDGADIATDQSTAPKLFAQDVLIQNGTTTVSVVPAHKPHIRMKHAFSMLDFRIMNVVEADIIQVVVELDNKIYNPYRVVNSTNQEYLLIIPAGSEEPVVRVTTQGGANYYQTTVDIKNSLVNHCYLFSLEGLDLALGEITIEEWATGPGIPGEYTTERTYPTLRGPANQPAILIYDTGAEQPIEFNDQGEVTERPLGRKLVAINIDGIDGGQIVELDPAIILRNMLIDLTTYFQ